jgi:hypothetical protein
LSSKRIASSFSFTEGFRGEFLFVVVGFRATDALAVTEFESTVLDEVDFWAAQVNGDSRILC